MIDKHALIRLARQFNGREDVTIDSREAASGAVKALVYSAIDHCFYITVDGRERMRSDIPETIFQFFNDLAPG